MISFIHRLDRAIPRSHTTCRHRDSSVGIFNILVRHGNRPLRPGPSDRSRRSRHLGLDLYRCSMLRSIHLDDFEPNTSDTRCARIMRVLPSPIVSIRDRHALESHAPEGSHESCCGGDRLGTDRRRDRSVWTGSSGNSLRHAVSLACHSQLVGRTLGIMGGGITIRGHLSCR